MRKEALISNTGQSVSVFLEGETEFIKCALLQPNLHNHALPRTHSSSSLPGEFHMFSD